MATIKKRTVAPIYAVAGVWLFFALFWQLYAPSHYITATLVSIAAAIVARGIWPTRVFEIPDPEPEPQPEEKAEETAEAEVKLDPKLEALIKERNRAISEMRRLNDNIEDPTISGQIDQLEHLAAKIIDHVVANPDKLPQIRKFLNYYLPTTIKLLNSYDRMGAAGVTGEHIGGTMKKIEDILATILQSFEKQMDSLFANEAMDISADITVMENLLAQEGLGSTQL